MSDIELPGIKPKVKKRVKHSIKIDDNEESQVIVHCKSTAEQSDIFIRVWKSIFLYDNHSAHISKLAHHEKITLAPNWTIVPQGSSHFFTLIFSGLPKSCNSFDIIEKIPQKGAFEKRNIPRNKKDVYYVNFS